MVKSTKHIQLPHRQHTNVHYFLAMHGSSWNKFEEMEEGARVHVDEEGENKKRGEGARDSLMRRSGYSSGRRI